MPGALNACKKGSETFCPWCEEHVYHPKFCGSFSIKSVLPAQVPGMTYKGMGVEDGAQAGVAYLQITHEDMPKQEKKRLRDNLLKYCEQDTLAMVRIVADLKEKSTGQRINA